MAIDLSFLGSLPEGLLTAEQQVAAQDRARQAAALQLGLSMVAGATGQRGAGKPGLAQIVGQAGPAALQAYQGSFDQTLKNLLTSMQLSEFKRKQTEQETLRQLWPQVLQVQRGPATEEVIPAETGDIVSTRPGAVTGVSINKQMLPALAMAGPAGIEAIKGIAGIQEALQGKTYQLKPGEQVVSQEGKVIAGVPANPEKVDLGNQIAFVDPTTLKPVGFMPKGKAPGELTTTELAVGKDFKSIAEPYIGIGQAYKKIQASATNPSPAGDISLIFGYMKILDPGSVVREGEFATASNAGGIGENIRNLYNRIVSGERLTETQRADFLNQSRLIVKSQQDLFNQSVFPRFKSIVETNNLNPNNVMFDPFAGIDTVTPIKAEKQGTENRAAQLKSILFPTKKQ